MSKLNRLRTHCGNGVNCPSIDRREEGGLVVTGDRIDNPELPAHEASVVVPDTLIPEVASLDIPDLAGYLAERHTTDLFRLETLDHYDVSSDDDYHRYVRGAPEPEASVKSGWLDQLRSDTAAGRRWRRVHVLRSPLNDYLRYECWHGSWPPPSPPGGLHTLSTIAPQRQPEGEDDRTDDRWP